MNALKRLAACVAAAGLVLTAGCAGAGTLGATANTVTIAMVSNSQMTDARELSYKFEEANPDIKLRFITLSENQARAKITASTSMGGGEFDVVMISNYETPQWAENGWLVNLSDYARKTPGYDENDFIPSLRESLSYEGSMYSVPFYGESSFLMYRKDLLEQAGITMPRTPAWQQVRDAAEKLDNPDTGMVGICLRGKPGWGEVLAPLDTVINTFGGRWYDMDWNAQLTSPEVVKAVEFYVDTVQKYGEPGAATSGFGECATQFAQGRTAMWYDATSAVSTLEDPESSNVVGKVGYAMAPMVEKPNSGWLYTWSLGIPASSDKKDAAWKFISWMTDKNYIRLVGEELGWARVPPGSRLSTYQIPEYKEVSAAFGQVTLDSIEGANPLKPTVQPVPYTGIQFLAIPEFQDLGTRVSQQISAAIAGQKSVVDALEQSQEYAEVVGRTYQEKS
ncbi:MAG: ABC transporter substrate-binding protein [Mycobacterium sp.]